MAEVLYLDLKKDNIGISVVHPGFVETELTAQNDFKMPALISSEQAALEMIKGYELGHFEIHFPKRFTRFLKFLRILPYRLYFAIVSRFTGL
jgi:short-subunit dehydrogenase